MKTISLLVRFFFFVICVNVNVFAQQGACCIPLTGCVIAASEENCTTREGIWVGGTCNATACPAPVGGCCRFRRDNGEFLECSTTTEANCQTTMGNLRIWRAQPCSQLNCVTLSGSGETPAETITNAGFTAIYNEESNTVKIEWQNLPQYSSANFFVQRSRDGIVFKTIGLLDILPNAVSTAFIDNYPLTEGHYRIYYTPVSKEYASQTLSVFAVKSGKLVLHPNPATSTLRVYLSNMQLFNTDVSIYDMAGRRVFNKTINKGAHPELNLSALPAGTFIVHARQNGIVYVEKLQKQ